MAGDEEEGSYDEEEGSGSGSGSGSGEEGSYEEGSDEEAADGDDAPSADEAAPAPEPVAFESKEAADARKADFGVGTPLFGKKKQ